LNRGLCTCYAGTPPLELCHLLFLLSLFWRWGLAFYLGWPEPKPYYLSYSQLLRWGQACARDPAFFHWVLANIFVWGGLASWSSIFQPLK
jgi:hypothetical protein